ncbi:MAG: FAD-binding oxidoreductase [Cyanobacteria bacterium J06621_11]
MSASQQVVEQVAALLGEGSVAWDAVSPAQQTGIMAAIDSAEPPAAIAYPETTESLGQLMALTHKNQWRVLPMGQGSKISWGGLTNGIDLVVSTAKLNRVVDHAVGDFTVTVEPGLKFADLRSQLATEKQLLAIDPTFSEQATIGGIVATADAGSLRQRYGGLRDMLIGVQFIRHDGEVARAGGRVVKNVAGYDLMKLMTGAYGSLGILSELTFRLYPINKVSRTLILSGGEMALEAAISEVRMSGLTPVALDLTLVRQTAALTNVEAKGHMSLIARFQGIADGVNEQTERLKKVATTHSMQIQQLDGEADKNYWQKASELIASDTLYCKVGMRPSALPALLAMIEGDSRHESAQVTLHGSSGLGWVQWPAAIAEGEEMVAALEKMRSHCQNNGGFLTILQAPKSLKQSVDVWGYTGNALKVMRDIKQKFDPQSSLSPGRFVGGL